MGILIKQYQKYCYYIKCQTVNDLTSEYVVLIHFTILWLLDITPGDFLTKSEREFTTSDITNQFLITIYSLQAMESYVAARKLTNLIWAKS